MEETEQDVVIDLLPSGRVKFKIDNTTYTWRRAKLGELAGVDAFNSTYIEDNPNATVVDVRIAWWTMMFDLLSEEPLANASDLPGSFAHAETVNRVKGHLWAVPLVRSSEVVETPVA